ncbi:MAG TPA: RNA methyltransferase [Nitrososphaeraceae archaeon]|nr:RNA methyltransferase [Nitrososphaeraceae archaeon]
MVIGVALVEPHYEYNVGYVARIMKNFGFTDMFLIDPKFNEEEAIRFATHGKDVLSSATIVSLKELRNKFDILIGTTALPAKSRLNVVRNFISPTQLSNLIRQSENKIDFCIVLGRESSGLLNLEMEICDLVVIIDTKTEYKTMNISHALAILLYELSKRRKHIGKFHSVTNKDLATRQELDLLIYYVNRLANITGYDKHKLGMLNVSARRLLARALPKSKEVMLMVSLLRGAVLTITREDKEQTEISN